MIDWVNKRLNAWGEWMAGARSSGGGGGYSAYQLVHIRGTAGSEVLCDPDVMETDRILAQVKVTRPELYDVAYSRYVQGMSNQTIAGRMRCHLDTVYSRVDSLHKIIDKRMSSISVKN